MSYFVVVLSIAVLVLVLDSSIIPGQPFRNTIQFHCHIRLQGNFVFPLRLHAKESVATPFTAEDETA